MTCDFYESFCDTESLDLSDENDYNPSCGTEEAKISQQLSTRNEITKEVDSGRSTPHPMKATSTKFRMSVGGIGGGRDGSERSRTPTAPFYTDGTHLAPMFRYERIARKKLLKYVAIFDVDL